MDYLNTLIEKDRHETYLTRKNILEDLIEQTFKILKSSTDSDEIKEEAEKCLINAKQKGLSVKKLISTDVDGTKITLMINENLTYEFELEYLDGQHVYRQVRNLVPESWLQ